MRSLASSTPRCRCWDATAIAQLHVEPNCRRVCFRVQCTPRKCSRSHGLLHVAFWPRRNSVDLECVAERRNRTRHVSARAVWPTSRFCMFGRPTARVPAAAVSMRSFVGSGRVPQPCSINSRSLAAGGDRRRRAVMAARCSAVRRRRVGLADLFDPVAPGCSFRERSLFRSDPDSVTASLTPRSPCAARAATGCCSTCPTLEPRWPSGADLLAVVDPAGRCVTRADAIPRTPPSRASATMARARMSSLSCVNALTRL